MFVTIQEASRSDIVVGANEGRATFIGLLAAKIVRKPFIAWVHNNWTYFKDVNTWRGVLALKIACILSDKVVICSEGAAGSIMELVGRISNLRMIYNGIPTDSIRKLADEPLPDPLGKIYDRPTVVTVGRLDYQKGHEYLISAHAQLLRERIPHNLVIVGQGGLLPELQQQAASLGVTDSVHFVGFHTNPYPFMKRATVFALPSRFEGFGLALAEAMACGTPVVSFNCPSGPEEILDGGKYGLLAKPESPESLAEEIKQLLCNPKLHEKFAQLALQRSQVFDAVNFARDWEVLFKEVLGMPSPMETTLSY